jgi:hypothetical protein
LYQYIGELCNGNFDVLLSEGKQGVDIFKNLGYCEQVLQKIFIYVGEPDYYSVSTHLSGAEIAQSV